jgi:hypothetical protein
MARQKERIRAIVNRWSRCNDCFHRGLCLLRRVALHLDPGFNALVALFFRFFKEDKLLSLGGTRVKHYIRGHLIDGFIDPNFCYQLLYRRWHQASDIFGWAHFIIFADGAPMVYRGIHRAVNCLLVGSKAFGKQLLVRDRQGSEW